MPIRPCMVPVKRMICASDWVETWHARCFLFQNDLQQDARQALHLFLPTTTNCSKRHDHASHRSRDVAAGFRVVQPAVGYFDGTHASGRRNVGSVFGRMRCGLPSVLNTSSLGDAVTGSLKIKGIVEGVTPCDSTNVLVWRK